MFVNVFVHNQRDYWELEHKIFFDPIKRLAIVYDHVTTLDIKIDLYSDMKEWMKLSQRDNLKFKPPCRAIGGDTTSSGQFAGDIYFMQNGWKISYDPRKVQVSGVIFSDDFDTPWVFSGDLTPVYPVQVSSLVTAVAPSLEGLNIPTSTENATAVRTELTTELSRIDVNTSTRASQTTADSIEGKVDSVEVTLATISLVIDDILKYGKNNTKIDAANKQLIIYDDNGIDEIKRYDLKDRNGVASIVEIFERIAV